MPSDRPNDPSLEMQAPQKGREMGADPFNLISKEAFQIVILILHFVIPHLPLLNLQIHLKPKRETFIWLGYK